MRISKEELDPSKGVTLLDKFPITLCESLRKNNKYTDFCDRLAERGSEFMKHLNDHGHVTLRIEYYENSRIDAYIDKKSVGNLRMNSTDIHDILEEIRDNNLGPRLKR